MNPFQVPATSGDVGKSARCKALNYHKHSGSQQSLIQRPLHARAAQGCGFECNRCHPFTPDGTFWPGSPILKPIQLNTNLKNNSGKTSMIFASFFCLGGLGAMDETLFLIPDFHSKGTPPRTGGCVPAAGDWVRSWVLPASQPQNLLVLHNAYPKPEQKRLDALSQKAAPRPISPESCPKNMAPCGRRPNIAPVGTSLRAEPPKPLVSVLVCVSTSSWGEQELLTSAGSLGRCRGLLVVV